MPDELNMRRLTNKELEIMTLFWHHPGGQFVKDLHEFYDEPKPHINTISSQVRTLEKDGFLRHKSYGGSYQYFPVLSEKQYRKEFLTGFVRNFFGNSYREVVSSFVHDDKITVDELEDLIRQVREAEEQK